MRKLRTWGTLAALGLGLCASACSDDDASPGDAAPPGFRRNQMMMSTSDGNGLVRVGPSTMPQAEIFLVDATTQRPIAGVLAQAVEEPEGTGYLVRLSKDVDAYRPELVHADGGRRRTIALAADTADVHGRAVRVHQPVYDDELVAEASFTGIAAIAEREGRPDIVFAPALVDADMGDEARFALYRAALPSALVALRINDGRPKDGTLVRTQGRVVSTSGAHRSGARVAPEQVAAVAKGRPGESRAVPSVLAVVVPAPDATGAALVRWSVEDPEGRLLGFDVGVDRVDPNKRLGREARELPITVLRGNHFACVRPVFDGADVDPQVACASFDASAAPPAPDVRVRLKVLDETGPRVAGRALPVEIEVENVGSADVAAFTIDVLLSRDGRPEGGLGEVRTLSIDGIKAGQRSYRRTDITALRDGPLFVVAQADGRRQLTEANAEDNLARLPLAFAPAGRNHAPVLSLATTSNAGGGAILKGQALRLGASALDREDGDLTRTITWLSSRDGVLGTGATLDTMALTPGYHRVQARVVDQGVAAGGADAGAPAADQRALVVHQLAAGVAEPPSVVSAEIEVTVVDDKAPVNSPPVISAGADLTTTVGATLEPLASARDADGDALTFAWTAALADGTPATAALADADKLRPRFSPLAPGTYRLTLAVSDGKIEEKDQLEVRVLAAAENQPPAVTLTMPAVASAGQMVRATATASDPDGDGLTVSFALDRPPGSTTLLLDAQTLMPGFVPDLPGSYTLTAAADDGRGGKSAVSATIVVAPGTDAGAPADAGTSDGPPPITDGPAGADAGAPIDAPGLPDAPAPIADAGTPGPDAPAPPVDAATPPADAPAPPADAPAPIADAFEPPDAFTPVADTATPPDDAPPPPPDVAGPADGATMGPPDMGPMTGCDPVKQAGCVQGFEGCYVDPDAAPVCLIAGSKGEGVLCNANDECLAGLGCFFGNDGQRVCRAYCHPPAPACPPAMPLCAPVPGTPFGICMTNPPDGGMPPPDGAPPPDGSPPPDGASPMNGDGGVPCDPINQANCPKPEDRCYIVDPMGKSACVLPGTITEGGSCGKPSDCVPGTGCFGGPDGFRCRAICEPASPQCNGLYPHCAPFQTGPYGACMPPPPDGGMPPNCDPAAQTGCAGGDACYVLGSMLGCFPPGSNPRQTSCSSHADCMTGTGCEGGPEGQACRQYCDTTAPNCPGDVPMCAPLGLAPWGVCVAMMPPPMDASASFDAL